MQVSNTKLTDSIFRKVVFPDDFLRMLSLLYWEEGEGRPLHSGKWLGDALGMSQDRLRDVRRRWGDFQRDSLRQRMVEVKAPPGILHLSPKRFAFGINTHNPLVYHPKMLRYYDATESEIKEIVKKMPQDILPTFLNQSDSLL